MTQRAYIGRGLSTPIVVRVLKYDPWRKQLVETLDRDQLIAAIAEHLRVAMSDGGTLQQAYSTYDRSDPKARSTQFRR